MSEGYSQPQDTIDQLRRERDEVLVALQDLAGRGRLPLVKDWARAREILVKYGDEGTPMIFEVTLSLRSASSMTEQEVEDFITNQIIVEPDSGEALEIIAIHDVSRAIGEEDA